MAREYFDRTSEGGQKYLSVGLYYSYHSRSISLLVCYNRNDQKNFTCSTNMKNDGSLPLQNFIGKTS